MSEAFVQVPLSSTARPIGYSEFTLPNGLHVILHQDRATPIVCVAVMYHVGSKNETPDRRGFAHFFEHLLFEGSANIARGEFSRHVERAGGVLNANTSADRTYYYEVLPSNHLELGLWLESERMLHARVDRKGVDTQREVVREERRQRYENQPYGGMIIEVLKRAYSVHPYQWPTIGYMEDLDTATEADYQAFYKRFYVPGNAALVVAGDIDTDRARELVWKYFADIPAGAPIERPSIVEPPIPGEVRDVVYDRIQLPAVVQAYRLPARGAEGFYAADMVNRLLSNGSSARLNKALRDEQGSALQTGAFSLAFEDPGLSVLYAVANSGVDAAVLERSMDAEVQRIAAEGVTDAEMAKLKVQLETEAVQEQTRVAGRAAELATARILLGDTALVNTELDRYLALTAADVQQAAARWFDPRSRVVLHYRPMPERR